MIMNMISVLPVKFPGEVAGETIKGETHDNQWIFFLFIIDNYSSLTHKVLLVSAFHWQDCFSQQYLHIHFLRLHCYVKQQQEPPS